MMQFLSNGGLSKMLWIILTFLCALGAIVVFMIEVAKGDPVNQYVGYVVVGVLSHVFTIGGSVNTSTQLEKKDSTQAEAINSAITTINKQP